MERAQLPRSSTLGHQILSMMLFGRRRRRRRRRSSQRSHQPLSALPDAFGLWPTLRARRRRCELIAQPGLRRSPLSWAKAVASSQAGCPPGRARLRQPTCSRSAWSIGGPFGRPISGRDPSGNRSTERRSTAGRSACRIQSSTVPSCGVSRSPERGSGLPNRRPGS